MSRVAEQRRGDAEPLAHAERELAGALARDVVQADQVEHLVDPAARDAVRLREASRWLWAVRPVCTAFASSSAPTSCSGAGCSR